MADLTPKTIGELPDDTSLSGSELFPVMDGSTSRKISLQTLRNQFAANAFGTELEADANLDDLLDPATYICYGNRNFNGDRPTAPGYGFKLFVTYFYLASGTKFVLQIAYEVNTTVREYRRYHNASGWTQWYSHDFTTTSMLASVGDTAYGLDLNNLKDPGTYYVSNPTNVTNGPSTTISYRLFVLQNYTASGDQPRVIQLVYVSTPTCTEFRRYCHGDGTWSDWLRFNISETNSAISSHSDKLAALGNGNVSLKVITVSTSADGVDIALTSGKRGMLFLASRSVSSNGLYAITCVSDGTVYVTPLVEGPRLVLTATANKVNIKFNADSYYAYGLYAEY